MHRRIFGTTIWVLLLLTLCVASTSGIALADAPTGKGFKGRPPPPGVIPPGADVVPLVLLRSGERPASVQDITPNDERWGDCGYAYMWLTDLEQWVIGLEWGAWSSLGDIASDSWTWQLKKHAWWIYWDTVDQDSGSTTPNGSRFDDLAESDVYIWGAGTYKGILSDLVVTLVDGRVCTGLHPEDTISMP